MKANQQAAAVIYDVRAFGAKGDGITDDTLYVQAAINSCPPNGRVLIPEGSYYICGIYLKSHMELALAKGAKLIFSSDEKKLPVLPGRVEGKEGNAEIGTWEGEAAPMYQACINMLFAEHVTICGEGIVDGNASFDDWWSEERKGKSPHRPRLLFMAHCRDIKVAGITFLNSPSWCIHPYFSERLLFQNITVRSPKNAPNTDGLNPESCSRVEITGCHFSVGDDCIAIKSGKMEMGMRYQTPCREIRIWNCLMENGHGAVTIGSETGAGVYDVHIKDCRFLNTDRGFRLKTRRGRGKLSRVDHIVMEQITMDGVHTPFSVNSFYFCDADGTSDYVQNKAAMPVDERTPQIGTLQFRDIVCKNTHIAAGFFYGLPEQKIEKLIISNVDVSYEKDAIEGIPDMLCGISPMRKSGFIIKNVKEVSLTKVSVEGALTSPVEMEGAAYVSEGKTIST